MIYTTESFYGKIRKRATPVLIGAALLFLGVGLAGCGGGDVEATQKAVEASQDAAEARLQALEARLAERSAELDDLQTKLEERVAGLDRRAEELDALAASLEDRQAQLERRSSQLAARAAEAEDAEARLAREREALAEERAEIDRDADRLAEEQAAAERAERERLRSQPPAVFVEAVVPAGTVFEAEVENSLSSASSRVGESFRARLAHDLLTADGTVAAPAGSELVGTVTEAVPLKKIGGQARLAVRFERLTLPSGRSTGVDASFYGIHDESQRDAATISGGAAAGAVIGRILAGKREGRDTFLGALLGAAAGTVIAARSGEEVEIPEGTILTLELDQPLETMVPWKSRYREP